MATKRRKVVGPATGIAVAGALALVLAAVAVAGTSQRTVPRTTVVVTDTSLTVSRASILEGVVTFVATNRGRKPHAFAIQGPSLSLRTPTLASGKTARLKVVLRPGRYRLWDPVGLGRSKQQFIRVTAPPKVTDPALVRPGAGNGIPEPDWDCAADLNDERC